jgi:ABC-2 type transport system ATP-binding protein
VGGESARPSGLIVTDMTVAYPMFQLGPLSCHLAHGGVMALIGTNGSGKSTFIRSLLGLEQLRSGSIEWEGAPLNTRSPLTLSGVGYVSDSNADVLAEFTPEEYWSYRLLAYERARHLRDPDAMRRARDVANLLDFPVDRQSRITSLSLGTSRKAQLIGALMTAPDLLILDEPFIGLDFIASRALENVLRAVNQRGTTILISNHDLTLAARLATDVMVLHQGSVVLSGSVDTLGGVGALEDRVSAVLLDAREKHRA